MFIPLKSLRGTFTYDLKSAFISTTIDLNKKGIFKSKSKGPQAYLQWFFSSLTYIEGVQPQIIFFVISLLHCVGNHCIKFNLYSANSLRVKRLLHTDRRTEQNYKGSVLCHLATEP